MNDMCMSRKKAGICSRGMKRRLQWRSLVVIPVSSMLIASTLSGYRCGIRGYLYTSPITDQSKWTFLTAEAFLTPVTVSTPRTPFRGHAIPSTLVTDTPTQSAAAVPEEWSQLRSPAAFSPSDNLMSISSNAAARHFEVSGGQRHTRLSYENRYGGRATGGTGVLDGNIRISDGRHVTGRNGVLGFDVGLSMLPSEISLSSSSTLRTAMDATRTIDNPTSPIKKQIISNLPSYRTSYADTATLQRTNRVRTSNDVSLLEKNANRRYGGTAARTRDALHKTSSVPAWFPYIPTRSQIQTLKLVQLKDACTERAIRKTGNKADLQQRLLTWTREQHDRIVLGRSTRVTSTDDDDTFNETHDDDRDNYGMAEIDPLIRRRKALLTAHEHQKKHKKSPVKRGTLGFDAMESKRHRIHHSKSISSVTKQQLRQDDADERKRTDNLLSSPSSSKTYLSQLTRTFHDSSNNAASSNNYQIQQLYLRAKQADQSGNLPAARRYLTQLRDITRDNDTRVLRRLSRLELQSGHYHRARAILQSGLRTKGTDDAYLLQGLGNLDLARGDVVGAREYYRRAVLVAPKGYANPHHALGTLEHSSGNIRSAATVLRNGLESCPTNHRLHHALGDLYREAKMGELAEIEYRKGLECIDAEVRVKRGNPKTWGKSFFYAALGYLAYDRVQTDECRKWLWKSVDYEGGNSMHAQGWLALAQLEESEGRFDVARNVYRRAIENYERKRRIVWSGTSKSSRKQMDNSDIIPAIMGDRWSHVYNSWVNMEENQGATYYDLNNLHSRAAVAFPDDWKNLQRWAKLQVRYERHERARTLFELAYNRAGGRNAEPYRLYAEYEMSLDNHERARSILFLGAQSLSQSSDGAMGNSDEFSKLYHTWGVCEWYLQNFDRAETLFDHALRLADSGEAGSPIRMLVQYSIARFLFHAREDCVLAQHCICLALTETALPRFSDRSRMWVLWADIARGMDNKRLVKSCVDQAEKVRTEGNTAAYSSVLDLDIPSNPSTIPSLAGPTIHQLLRKAPWYHKIVHQGQQDSMSWYNGVTFPDTMNMKEYSKEDSDIMSLSICQL